MGEWSDYFEDFPEENPANYINGHFSPPGAQTYQPPQRKFVKKPVNEQAAFDADIDRTVAKHNPK
jgi:hypothetical protein